MPTSILGLTAETARESGFDAPEGESDSTSFARIIGSIAKIFISLLGVLFISYFIYAGFLWMTAAGNEEKITKAKTIMRGVIIGLVIVLASAAIYYFVKDVIIGSSSSSTGIPSGQ